MTGFVTPSYMANTQTVSSELVKESAQLSAAMERMFLEYLRPDSVPAEERERRRVEHERRIAEQEATIAATLSEHQARVASMPAGPLRDVLELHAPSGTVDDFGCQECADSEYGAAEFPCRTYCAAAGIPCTD